jgi:hypothetical protein
MLIIKSKKQLTAKTSFHKTLLFFFLFLCVWGGVLETSVGSTVYT